MTGALDQIAAVLPHRNERRDGPGADSCTAAEKAHKLNPKQRPIIPERYAAVETAATIARKFEVGEATAWRALSA
jgi:hypothetical protein